MWWSRPIHGARRARAAGLAALVLVAGLTAACGFRPLYAQPDVNVRPHLSAIKVSPIADRTGQQLRNMLYDRLTPRGQPANPAYLLDVELTVHKANLGIQQDETVTRARLDVFANYVLRAADTGAVLDQGHSQSTTTYDIVRSQFATLAAEQDAERRALRVIGDDITVKLSFFFDRRLEGAES